MKKLQKIWNDYEKWIILIGAIIFLSVFSIFYYYHAVQKNINGNVKIINTLTDNTPQMELPINGTVLQTFKITENFNGFQIKFATIGGTTKDRITVQITEQASGQLLQQWTKSYTELQESRPYDFLMDNGVLTNNPMAYHIMIENTNVSGTGTAYVYTSKSECYPEGDTYVTGELHDKDIVFNVYQKQDNAYAFITPFYVFLAITGIMAVALLVLSVFFWKFKIEKVFLMVTFIMGMLYMIILPPFSSPDEPIHFGTAYKISNWMMGLPLSGENGVVSMRESDANVEYGTIPSVKTYQYTFDHMFERNNDSQSVEWKHMDLGIRNKILHLPSAIGISVARILHLGSVQLIYLGRFTNLLFYLTAMYFAIKITPIGKSFFVAFSLSPMMLELISSYSYDCVINGLACVSIAILFHCIFRAEKIQRKEIILLLVLATLFAPCKVVYSFIFVLVLFIPQEKFDKKWKYYCLVGATAVVMFISILYVNLESILVLGGISTTPATEVITDLETEITPSTYSVAWCLHHPLKLCEIYWNTFLTYGKYYFITMFGGLLGWLEISVSNLVVYLVAFFTIVTLFLDNNMTPKIKRKHRVASVVIIVIVSMLILLSMFFACSPYGMDVILGAQGRYFLTVFPLLLIIVGNKKIKINSNWDKYVLLCLLMVNVYAIFQVFTNISAR